MNDDAVIREAIRNDDRELGGVLNDEALIHEVVLQNFRGRRRWLTIFPFILSLVYAGLMFWCGYQFFQTETTKFQIAWATGFLAFALSVCTTKIGVWGEWQRNSLAREIKRLELVVADLRDRLAS